MKHAATLYGECDISQLYQGSKTWVMVSDYIMLYNGVVLLMQERVGLMNGASMPFILMPLLGRPLEGLNLWWSSHHDGAYGKSVQLFSASDGAVIDVLTVKRKFFDRAMKAAMISLGCSKAKTMTAYAGVRVGGWWAWRKGRR
jgi:hypothetical protein